MPQAEYPHLIKLAIGFIIGLLVMKFYFGSPLKIFFVSKVNGARIAQSV
jgi:hypothetical protein